MADHHDHNNCGCSHKGHSQDDGPMQEQLDAAGKSLTRALQLSFTILKLIMAAVVIMFLLSGIVQIQPDEQALLLRFGRIVGAGEDALLKPGITFSWPSPIDEIVRIPVETVQTLQIDSFWYFETAQEKLNPEKKRPARGPLDPLKDGYCLTGNESLIGAEGSDYNIVHSKWSVTYKIGSPAVFFENVYMRDRKPGEDFLDAATGTVEPLLESLASDAIVSTLLEYDIDKAIKSEEGIASRVKGLLQEKLDLIESGIEIDAVRADQIVWPRQVDAAFQALTKARQESEQARVDAGAYSDKLLTDTGGPNADAILEKLKQSVLLRKAKEEEISKQSDLSQEAKEKTIAELTARFQEEQEKEVIKLSGQVRAVISEARAYKTGVVSKAKANAEYLLNLLPEYQKRPTLVLQDIYLRAVTEVLANADEKFIMQRSADGKPVEFRLYMNRDPNIKKQQAEAQKDK